jgi:hypothetical protein
MNGDFCPICGLEYKDLRTKLTFKKVYSMFWTDSEDSNQWRYKRRHTILGKWHQIKKEMWQEHLHMCKQLEKNV